MHSVGHIEVRHRLCSNAWAVSTRVKWVIGMWRLVIAGFLVLHGVLHAVIWIPPQRGGELPNFGSQASWLFAEVRPVVVTLALIAAIGFAVSGMAYAAHLEAWAVPASLAAVA
jgi:hypothetical protein